MKSPKFAFAAASIQKCVSAQTISSLWKDKIRAQLRKQVIWDVIEYRDIDNNLTEFSSDIASAVLTASFRAERPHTYLVEKSRGLCRQMMLIGPRELVLLQCLSSALHKQIVAKSPSKSAFFQPGDMKWSDGNMTTGSEYGSVASWKKFQKQVLKFRKENKFIVITDVANFYDFINFRHLRNIISSLCTVDESILDLLLHLLNDLTWTPDYMPKQDIGMPQIEAEAPRVLANAMLFELDRVAEKYAYKNYARFMDDIDCGVSSIVEAKKFVRDVDLTLQSRQLRLNSAKTKILTQEDAFKHFCVAENARLDKYMPFVTIAATVGTFKAKLGARLLTIYEKWLDRDPSGAPGPNSVFRQGNGAKIHKRILTFIRRCGAEVPATDLIWLIKNDPGMRQVAFRHLTHYSKANANLYAVLKILKRSFFVDDAAYADFASFCAYASFKPTNKLKAALSEAASFLNDCGPIGVQAATIIICRLGNPSDLVSQASLVLKKWSNYVWLCRFAAGLYPIVFTKDKPLAATLLQTIQKTRHQAVLDVLEHHLNLMNSASYVAANYQYLAHTNASYPKGIYFPKAIQILSVKHNTAAAKTYNTIVTKHPGLTNEPFYKAWGF